MESLLRRGAPPRIIAHRGASARAPENTMPAFLAAWQAGADWVETDVQPASDGVPMLMHDQTLERTTDGSGPLRDHPSDVLAALDAGSWFGPAFVGARIPRLSDLLATLSGPRRVLLEIKGEHNTQQVLSIVRCIRQAGAEHAVFLQSFEIPVLRELGRILPDEPVGLLVEQIGDDPVGACRELGATSFNPEAGDLLARPEIVAALHAAGVAIQPWTADDPAQWSALTDAGVDGIITNTPGALLAWLSARGHSNGPSAP